MSTRFGREMLDYRQQRQQRQQQQQQLQQTLATPTHGKRHTGGRGQPAGSQPGGPSPRCGRRHARQPRRPARRCRPRGAVGGGRAAGAGGRGGAGGAAESAPRAGVDRGEAKAEEVGGGWDANWSADGADCCRQHTTLYNKGGKPMVLLNVSR